MTTSAHQQSGLDVQWLGRRAYAEIWDLQKEMLEQRIADEISDTLLLVEHEPVYTWGKRTDPAHLGEGETALKALGADTFQVERGGEVTYHGPGQLVGYPICNLRNLSCGRDLHKYMRALEEVMIRVLDTYGLTGERVEGLTGVWVEGQLRIAKSPKATRSLPTHCVGGTELRMKSKGNEDNSELGIRNSKLPSKVAALGVRVRKWCTMHGFALNVTDEVLPWFRHIIPCGIGDRPVTSLQSLSDEAPDMAEVRERTITAFRETLLRPQ